jgi:hypothetical protein
MRLELVDDSPRHINGDGKTDALAVGHDGGVDPDNLPIHIEKRTTAVSGINGRIGLDKIVVGSGTEGATLGTDDPGCDRLFKPEGAANGHHPAAHRKGV